MNAFWRRLVASLLLSSMAALALWGCKPVPSAEGQQAGGVPDSYLFCFWNVENFFDDRADARLGPGDREYDAWFAANGNILKLKLERLTEALLKLNGGRGPDILALAEVESLRAAQLLQEALNDKLGDTSAHYTNVLMKEVNGGRHIAPAILTRLPVVRDKTRSHGRRQRILEGHIVVGGHDLVVIASHWTSRLQKDGARGRANYGDAIYGAYRAMHKSNPGVDFLVCGDFNDTPQDPSVTQHLHAVADIQAVLRATDPPLLFNLFADKDPREGFGTHYYNKWLIFDQIAVSPGLVDNVGWSCVPDSVQTVNSLYRPGDRLKRPWRFGGERDRGPRGYSDHFPVTVRLKVHNGSEGLRAER
jgi:endonuclease/exonuclease/phosphatase family metal-dependent hydrolase